jgi:NTP pyrophosphatase (non-canonical NTP hydrolase)
MINQPQAANDNNQEPLQPQAANDNNQEPLQPKNLKQAQQNYLLDKLQEESAEVIQAVSKIRRFGQDNSHPDKATTNLQDLIGELEDLLAIVGVLEHLQFFDLTKSQNNIKQKALQLMQ